MSEIDDPITLWFLAAVALMGIVYAGLGWTPSSYGAVLENLQVQGAGPVAGSSRGIRSDEWAVETPYFQATVRNRFRRINETSFYKEDLRNYYALPLADWSLVFKPQMWAFFLLPPAMAFSIYYAILMCGFLAGYHLLFRELGVSAGVAAAAAVIVYFSGFTQFWWTTYGPLLAGLPWILLIVLHPMTWWKKAALCAWAMPVFVFSHVYPALLLTLAWGSLIVVLAFRPSLVRSPREIAAIAVGVLSTLGLVYLYYADIIPVMRNTVYPGHRVSPAGGTPLLAVLSQLFPVLSFRLADYRNLTGDNICEIGAVGSFLPLLTMCLTRYKALRAAPAARKTLLILLAGFIAITLWEVAPVPAWIGRLLLWNTSYSQRWLFASGLLLTLASLSLWSNRLISLHPLRIMLFVLIGPAASLLFKFAWLNTPDSGVFDSPEEILLCGMVFVAGLAAWYVPTAARVPLVVIAIALMNVYAFGRFNPLQPARPIFQTPDSPLLREVRAEAAASPDGVVLDPRFPGAELNGLGFRSVNHTLLAPKLAVFQRYFPDMDRAQFNQVFNRYAHINLAPIALPDSPANDVIRVPYYVFVPVRNLRQVAAGPPQTVACSQPAGGGIRATPVSENRLAIEGWAPWTGETDAQGIRVLSVRPLRASPLATITRPDIAEKLQNYGFVKAGFKLQLSSADGKPLRADELAILAFGTAQGEIRLTSCR